MKINNILFITRRSIILLSIFIAIFTLSGCGSTPEYVVSRFFKLVYDGDTTSAKRLCTKSFLDKYGEGFDKSSQFMQGFNTQFGEGKISKDDFARENFESEITGKTAKVWAKDFSGFKIICAKQGLTWKVDDFSFDFMEMLKSLNINDIKDLKNLTPDKLKDLQNRK